MLKKFIFWSPMVSHVGTINAVLKSAISLSKKNKVYVIDVIGEFEKFKHNKNLEKIVFIKIFSVINYLPKTGIFSKFFLFLFSFLAIPKLFFIIYRYNPDIIFSYLLSIIPLSLCKFFFYKSKIICSIQGFPKLGILRKTLWKFFYRRSNFIITMTNFTKKLISQRINYDENKIFLINNPIISRKIKLNSFQNIKSEHLKIFSKPVMISVGRLTRQKNFSLLIEAFNEKKVFDKYNLVILGEGEDKFLIEKYILKNNLKSSVFLLGFVENPYKYIAKSSIYISTSDWEEPGHAILEAGYLNIPIITSDCPNGPKELYRNKINAIVFKTKNLDDLKLKIKEFENLNPSELSNMKKEMKKLTRNFSSYQFNSKISLILKRLN